MKQLGSVLKAWRHSQQFNVREAAQAIGISPATISRVERGDDLNAITLWRILLWLIGEAK